MKLTLLCLIFFVANSVDMYSQNRRDAVWCFGDSVKIDFNQSPPVLDYSATRSRGSSSSIADNKLSKVNRLMNNLHYVPK